MQGTQVQSLGWEDPLEKGMVTHFSILAWTIPWTEEPGVLSPWGCKESDTTKQVTFFLICNCQKKVNYSDKKENPVSSQGNIFGV